MIASEPLDLGDLEAADITVASTSLWLEVIPPTDLSSGKLKLLQAKRALQPFSALNYRHQGPCPCRDDSKVVPLLPNRSGHRNLCVPCLRPKQYNGRRAQCGQRCPIAPAVCGGLQQGVPCWQNPWSEQSGRLLFLHGKGLHHSLQRTGARRDFPTCRQCRQIRSSPCRCDDGPRAPQLHK